MITNDCKAHKAFPEEEIREEEDIEQIAKQEALAFFNAYDNSIIEQEPQPRRFKSVA